MLVNKTTVDHTGMRHRNWYLYACATCGGCVLTVDRSGVQGAQIDAVWPSLTVVSSDIPERAREYLAQAVSSVQAPAGAVMLAASAIDAMLRDKGLVEGSLYKRIDAAASSHLITEDMAAWAHEVRLDANDQRHTDDSAALPAAEDAERVIGFALSLGEFLYVLPAKVARGRTP
jgi:hypothetical protein